MSATLDAFVRDRLAALEKRHLRRHLTETRRTDAVHIRTPEGEFLSFASNDYLGLSRHPEVIAAALEATLRSGAGSGAARLVTGNAPENAELEARLAAFKGTQDSTVFGSGYLANLGIIAALMGSRDLVLLDELSHSCLLSGAKLAGCATVTFRHNDAAHCESLLRDMRREYRHVLVGTEGVFSMDGDLAPLRELAEICAQHDAWLLCDDAHGLGVLAEGRGSVTAADATTGVALQMGTLSKALGSYGGFVCAGTQVCEFLRNRASTFVYTTALPPGCLAASLQALTIIERDPLLVARPLALAREFTAAVQLPEACSAIVPLVIGESSAALEASAKLASRGFHVPAIRPPTVPQGTARLRFAFSAAHSSADVRALAAAIDELRLIGRPAP